MDGSAKIAEYLSKIPALADLTDDQRNALAEQCELLEIRRRDVVYLPGDPGGSLFAVASGRVKVSEVTRDGKALTLLYCSQNELFGETCVASGEPRQEMAEATENTRAVEIPRQPFLDLVANHGALGLTLAQLFASRRIDLENKLETLVFRDVTAKLAELLLQLADEHGVEDTRGIMVSLKITHQELANLIGSTRETVSLTLSQFKRKKLITTEGRKVIIADSESLRALF